MMRDPETILDELLFLRWQAGDIRAFEKLFGRHQSRILRLAYLKVRQQEAAADIAQDVWAAAIRTVRKVRDPAKFREWLDQIVRNKSIDWIRRQQRHRKVMLKVYDQESREDHPVETGQSSHAQQADPTAMDRLREALANLEPEQRKLLSMLYLHEHSVEQIAHELEIPTGTVKSRLYHAREALKRAYERNENDRPR